ncbi:spermatogenesis-associated protein 17 [Pimephales promelas]|uniref:spermatogenesis-associated protein 17 n=1 Tax=Pimephales promelas TaxID=90988 RepID=UPI001955E81A|nr:spermatogenesis-associated protein 17 [Pimephales promelas]KAG1972599.1 spermatogenesis-associated protein [Pimephales promelas]
MARLVKLYSQVDNVKKQYFIRNRIAEENRQKENEAAVRIQCWFRGCQVRAYLSHLHKNATLIQKIWRGFTARVLFRKRVKTAYFIMKMNFFNKMAVKIQQRWRGYYVRKYVHNYYARKRYLEGLTRKNEHIRRDIEEFVELQRKERERITLEKEEQGKTIQAQRLHFLLSTKQCPGVFNSPFREEPDEMELRLRKVKPLLARSAPKERKTPNIIPDLSNLMPNRERLPPIRKKPQGPFRPALEVQQQRQRPLEPSLRVATSITALEEAREELKCQEWRTRVIDQTFLPSLNTSQNKRYEGLMHTSTPFEQVAYGTKHFREEDLQGKKPFKTVFTTCHVFDKFGRLYSKAGNIV